MHFLKYEIETEIHSLHDKSLSIAYICDTSREKIGNTERHSCLCSAWTSILILHSLAITSAQVSSPQVLWQFWFFLFCSKGKNLKEQTLPYSKQGRICHHQCFCSSIENDGRCFQSSVLLGESLKWFFIFELDEIASVHSLHSTEVVNNFLFLFSTFPALSLEEVGSLNLHTVSLHIL